MYYLKCVGHFLHYRFFFWPFGFQSGQSCRMTDRYFRLCIICYFQRLFNVNNFLVGEPLFQKIFFKGNLVLLYHLLLLFCKNGPLTVKTHFSLTFKLWITFFIRLSRAYFPGIWYPQLFGTWDLAKENLVTVVILRWRFLSLINQLLRLLIVESI